MVVLKKDGSASAAEVVNGRAGMFFRVEGSVWAHAGRCSWDVEWPRMAAAEEGT